MSLFPDITPLTNQIAEFTLNQQQNQQAMIALLKQINLELTYLKQILQNKYA